MGIKIIGPRVRFFDVVKMLLDSDQWEFEKTFGTIEEMVHKEGFRYYVEGSCICLRNESIGMEQYAGIFECLPIALLANRNTRKVKASHSEKDLFESICAEGLK